MRRAWAILGATVLLAGCGMETEQRLHAYSTDGLFLFDHGQYLEARESFQAALALKPGDSDLLYNIGQCYDRQGVNDKAEKYYNDCLAQAPDLAAARFGLAEVQVRTGRLADATRMCQAWLARQPKNADPYALDGYLWHQAGDLPKAQARLQQALAIDPRNKRALIELGLVYEALHRPDRAAALYERALDQNPNQPEVARRLNALLAEGTGRPRLE